MSLDKSPASKIESEKLIQEIQHLIKVKGLKADLVPHADAPSGQLHAVADGCTGCTICSCMVCW
ncbi:MAG TPA: hypothetical protein VM661_13425 [Candidatus Sulfotelmatobacter sp.]|jgi:hypothetical protein|nr:hypothetical protein [Candidatus Sulfotelmatobacter sp.]